MRVDLRMARNRAAGLVGVFRDIGKGHRLEVTGVRAGRLNETGFPGHGVLIDFPDLRRAGASLPDDVFGGLDHGHASRKLHGCRP